MQCRSYLHSILVFVLLLGAVFVVNGQPVLDLKLPNYEDSVRFMALGDNGTGGRAQYEVAEIMARYHRIFPFGFAIMLGDNMYGGESKNDFVKKFERPYKPLLDAGVKFYASLGNHDDPSQRFYKPFNMGGKRYYTFQKGDVEFFALDTTDMDEEQLAWVEKELRKSDSKWKICFFHHPLYSSGNRHGSDEELQTLLEPLFIKYGVNAVFSGHDHFYQRIKPQHGIYYFISGAAGKLRRSNIRKESDLTAVGFDRDNSFMLVEIAGDNLYFQSISRNGLTVDSGVFSRPEVESNAAGTKQQPPAHIASQ